MREKLFSDFSEEKPQMIFTFHQREYYVNSSRLKISHGRRNEIRLINNFGFRHKQARKVFITRITVFVENSAEKRKTVYDESRKKNLSFYFYEERRSQSRGEEISTRICVVLRDFWNAACVQK